MSALGAIIGLLLAIALIIRRVSTVYSLMIGAVVGGLLGGLSLPGTVVAMIDGVKDIVPAIVRIIAAGVLSGVLIKTGAAASISHTIVNKLGKKHVCLALALSTMLLTAIGVFIDVSVITIAPIALIIGHKLSIPKVRLLFMMIAGGKCGNIISPNPNTIISAENFHAPLSSVMFVNIIPAVVGLFVAVYIIGRLIPSKGELVGGESVGSATGSAGAGSDENLPSFWASMTAPLVAIILLALKPMAGIVVDPLIALPAGGLVGVIVMRRWKELGKGMAYGLEKMSTVAILLVGTGTIAGIIKVSTMKDVIIGMLSKLSIGDTLVAPISGALMSAATASTTAGATIASSSFADIILAVGVSSVWGAAMINSGATVLDHMPHGPFFHATAGSVEMKMKERLKLIPYETLVGLTLATGTVLGYFLTRNI